MTTWALIACTKDKHKHTCPAAEMYTKSTLFKKVWAYATGQGQSPLILSAKYGLLLPDTVIDTYDETLINKRINQRREWALRVWLDLAKLLQPGDTVVSYMGQVYEEFILAWLQERDCTIERPLKGMEIGQRLAWLTERNGRS